MNQPTPKTDIKDINFVEFINTNKNRNTKDGYSISWRSGGVYHTGQINFNGGMIAKLQLDKFDSVRTFQDAKNKLIAVLPNNEPKDDSNRALRKNGNGRFLASVSFCRLAVEDYKYPTGHNLDYEVQPSGLVVLLKYEEPKE